MVTTALRRALTWAHRQRILLVRISSRSTLHALCDFNLSQFERTPFFEKFIGEKVLTDKRLSGLLTNRRLLRTRACGFNQKVPASDEAHTSSTLCAQVLLNVTLELHLSSLSGPEKKRKGVSQWESSSAVRACEGCLGIEKRRKT